MVRPVHPGPKVLGRSYVASSRNSSARCAAGRRSRAWQRPRPSQPRSARKGRGPVAASAAPWRSASESAPPLPRDPPAQGSRQQPEIMGYLADWNSPGQCVGGGDHRRVRPKNTGHLPDQDVLHYRERILGCRSIEQPFSQASARRAPQLFQRHHVIPHQVHRWPDETASRRQRERHRNVGVTCFEFDHRCAAGLPLDHGAGHPVDLACCAERTELVAIQVDPQASSGAGQKLPRPICRAAGQHDT